MGMSRGLALGTGELVLTRQCAAATLWQQVRVGVLLAGVLALG